MVSDCSWDASYWVCWEGRRAGKGEGKGDVQAYNAEYDDQAEMEDISDSEREAQDDAEDADPLAVDTCWR